jgi:hypothetical protein
MHEYMMLVLALAASFPLPDSSSCCIAERKWWSHVQLVWLGQVAGTARFRGDVSRLFEYMIGMADLWSREWLPVDMYIPGVACIRPAGPDDAKGGKQYAHVLQPLWSRTGKGELRRYRFGDDKLVDFDAHEIDADLAAATRRTFLGEPPSAADLEQQQAELDGGGASSGDEDDAAQPETQQQQQPAILAKAARDDKHDKLSIERAMRIPLLAAMLAVTRQNLQQPRPQEGVHLRKCFFLRVKHMCKVRNRAQHVEEIAYPLLDSLLRCAFKLPLWASLFHVCSAQLNNPHVQHDNTKPRGALTCRTDGIIESLWSSLKRNQDLGLHNRADVAVATMFDLYCGSLSDFKKTWQKLQHDVGNINSTAHHELKAAIAAGRNKAAAAIATYKQQEQGLLDIEETAMLADVWSGGSLAGVDHRAAQQHIRITAHVSQHGFLQGAGGDHIEQQQHQHHEQQQQQGGFSYTGMMMDALVGGVPVDGTNQQLAQQPWVPVVAPLSGQPGATIGPAAAVPHGAGLAMGGRDPARLAPQQQQRLPSAGVPRAAWAAAGVPRAAGAAAGLGAAGAGADVSALGGGNQQQAQQQAQQQQQQQRFPLAGGPAAGAAGLGAARRGADLHLMSPSMSAMSLEDEDADIGSPVAMWWDGKGKRPTSGKAKRSAASARHTPLSSYRSRLTPGASQHQRRRHDDLPAVNKAVVQRLDWDNMPRGT